jgi:predicted ribosomally synthesized six-cysteine peptide SCIFF
MRPFSGENAIASQSDWRFSRRLFEAVVSERAAIGGNVERYYHSLGRKNMKKTGHIRTIVAGSLRKPLLTPECGSCQTSCQSACKTSCTVGNQTCGISKK